MEPPDVIRLDVGGRTFTTQRRTLLRSGALYRTIESWQKVRHGIFMMWHATEPCGVRWHHLPRSKEACHAAVGPDADPQEESAHAYDLVYAGGRNRHRPGP